MTVGRLKELLEDMDDDAQVFIMMQQSWPFECDVAGVTRRDEFASCDDDDGEERWEDDNGELKPNDVFLCEGRQLRYGSKDAWSSCEE